MARQSSEIMFWTLILILLWFTANKLEAISKHGITTKKFTCSPNKDILTNATCFFARRGSVDYFTAEMHLNTGVVVDNIFVNVTILHRAPHEMKYKVYIGMNKLIIDFCAFVNGGKSAIAEIIFGNLTKYGNALKKCPVSGAVYLRNFPLDTSLYPSIIQPGDYIADIYVYFKTGDLNTFVIETKGYIEFKQQT